MKLGTRKLNFEEMYNEKIADRIKKELSIGKKKRHKELIQKEKNKELITSKEWFAIEKEIDEIMFDDKERSKAYIKLL